MTYQSPCYLCSCFFLWSPLYHEIYISKSDGTVSPLYLKFNIIRLCFLEYIRGYNCIEAPNGNRGIIISREYLFCVDIKTARRCPSDWILNSAVQKRIELESTFAPEGKVNSKDLSCSPPPVTEKEKGVLVMIT
jgi:hypothetical protein